MQNETFLHISEKLSPGSEGSLTETPKTPEGPDLVPTSDKNISSKGADSSDGLLPNATPFTSKTTPDNLSDLSGGKISEKDGDVQIGPEDKQGGLLNK